MSNLTNEQKAQMYNALLFQYQRIQEQIREIRAENFELSPLNEKKIKVLEAEAKRIYNQTAKLYL